MEGWCFSMFMLLKISLDNPCTCLSRHEKWHQEIGFWGLKNFVWFPFCLQENIIISKTLTEEIWDLTLRLNPVRYEGKSTKCCEYLYKNQGFFFFFTSVLSTLVFRLRWFRMLEIYLALAITLLCRRILISVMSISRLPWIFQS